MIDLVESEDELRKIHREIGRMNNKTQIEYLMKNRENLLARVESLEAQVAKKIPNFNPVDLRIFKCIYRVLSLYGRAVSESIFLSFEYESKEQPLEIVNHTEAFYACVAKVLGKKSSKKIESTILFEICNEFGLQLSKRSNTADAIKLVRSSMRQFPYGESSEHRAER